MGRRPVVLTDDDDDDAERDRALLSRGFLRGLLAKQEDD